MNRILLLLLIVLSAGCSSFKITAGGFTHHNGGSTDWIEGRDNNIIGIEFKISESGFIEFTDFKNSFGDHSQAVNYNLKWKVENDSSIGIKLGLVEGYTDKMEPFFLPVVTKELFEHVSFDFHWLPSVSILFLKLNF